MLVKRKIQIDIYCMIKDLLQRIFGTANDRYLKSFSATVEKINALETKYQKLSDTELKNNTNTYKKRVQQGESLENILPEAFAAVREAAKRVLKQRHYDVQLMGGIALHKGMISEMKTGEGKTLVSTLPAYLNALTGNGVHIVTVNDYLAKRDSEWMGQIYRFLGLTVNCIINGSDEDQRREAYNSDILYATNNELGFDYLRDNMKHVLEHCVQKPFNYAIIDEVDSILIDEARTPLVISGPSEDRSELYCIIDKLTYKLKAEDYELDEKSRSVSLTDAGTTHIEKLLVKDKLIPKDTSLFDIENVTILHHVNQALKAHNLFKNNVDYIIKDSQVMIIDEFTGRIMEGRRFSDGLHQALEAKELVPVQNENQTLASITFQNYFRLYPKLAGMTGTAMTEAAEFHDIYKLQVVTIPTNNPMIRKDEDDFIYRTAEEKYDAIIEEIEKCYAKNQPILVGTISIKKSEYISSILKKKKIKHNVLNAKHHEKEAFIIAQAGRPGAVTIATNMAGRGTDIMLGGNAEMLTKENIKTNNNKIYETELTKIQKQVDRDKGLSIKAGGLLVIGTERHESRRIDNQLRGRSGRMGDPGRSLFYLSLEDDLMRIFASEKISSILKTLGLKKGESIFHPMISRTIEKAQHKVEIRNYEIRKNLLKFDDVMSDQRKIIYEQRHSVIAAKNIHNTVTDIYQDLNQEIISTYIPEKKFKEEWDVDGLAIKLEYIYGKTMDIQTYLSKDGVDNKSISLYLEKQIDNLLKSKQQAFGDELFKAAEKRILLITIDQLWKDHLLSLDHLRHGIYLRAFAQKDPLNEYKREAFEYFSNMLSQIREMFITRVMRMELDENRDSGLLSNETEPKRVMFESRQDPALEESENHFNNDGKPHTHPKDRKPHDPKSWGKVGRNDLCPCGSNKKYKHCHGKLNN
jgi:preprotein translocase subunit SecA